MDFHSIHEPVRSALVRLEDIAENARRKYETQYSVFLDAETVVLAKQFVRAPEGFEIGFFGGYPEAERCIFGVWPEYEADEATEHFPLDLLKISCPPQKTLTHRDCLGSLLGLGIKREMIGDILCDERIFYVFVSRKISSYIITNLEKIGSAGVRIKLISTDDFTVPQPKTETKGIFIMSNRLDAILAGALDLSRGKAADLIHAARVSVNHICRTETSMKLEEGDLLSVRGFGRFRVGKTGNQSRKGRTYLEIIKYI